METASYLDILGKVNTERGNWEMIVIDGVVGCGKTSLMDLLVEKEGYTPFLEPIINNKLLNKFYYDRKRYSFALQIFFLNNRFKMIKEASSIEKSVLDRSIYGDAIFAKMLHENNEMCDEEFELYIDLLSNMLEHCNPPKLMVYLECSVDTAIKRIKLRNRDYEQVVEKDYWERLNLHYGKYFEDYHISPMLKINIDNADFVKSESDRLYIMDKLKKEIDLINSKQVIL